MLAGFIASLWGLASIVRFGTDLEKQLEDEFVLGIISSKGCTELLSATCGRNSFKAFCQGQCNNWAHTCV